MKRVVGRAFGGGRTGEVKRLQEREPRQGISIATLLRWGILRASVWEPTQWWWWGVHDLSRNPGGPSPRLETMTTSPLLATLKQLLASFFPP